MTSEGQAVLIALIIAAIGIAIGVGVIAQFSKARGEPQLGDENRDILTTGIGMLYLWATVELILCGLYFWVFREWLGYKDIPKIAFTVTFIGCAYLVPNFLRQRSTLAFIPYTAHLFLLIFLFLRDENIEYPHLLNIMYSLLASMCMSSEHLGVKRNFAKRCFSPVYPQN